MAIPTLKYTTDYGFNLQVADRINRLITEGSGGSGGSPTVQTLADAVELVELGGISVGDTVVVLDTLSTYQLKDGVSSRPSEIEGYILHVSSSFQYLENVFFEREVFPWERSGTGVQLALQVSRATGRNLVLSHGEYLLSSKLILQSNDKLIIKPSATLTATSGLTGSTMIEVGTNSIIADDVLIGGGGRINAAGLANRAIDVVHSRFSDVEDLSIDGAVISLIRVGGSGANGATYEFNITNVRGMNEQEENHPNSIGIYYNNATDCYLTNCVPVGYRKGIEVSSGSFSIEMSKVHPWGRVVHGAMIRGFSILGTASFDQCNADTPFDVIGLGGDLYGYFISGNVTGSNCRVFSNNSIGDDVDMDGRTIPYFFDGNNEAYISIGKVHGGSPTRRFKSFDGGDLVNNGVVTKITGSSVNYVTAP